MGERIKQYRIISNWNLADQVYEMELEGDSSWITHPGSFSTSRSTMPTSSGRSVSATGMRTA